MTNACRLSTLNSGMSIPIKVAELREHQLARQLLRAGHNHAMSCSLLCFLNALLTFTLRNVVHVLDRFVLRMEAQ